MITTEEHQQTGPDSYGLSHFFAELRRRRVCRAAALYALSMWALCQIVELVYLELGLPSWTLKLVIVLGLAGFPVTLILSWLFDITPNSIQRDGQERRGKNELPAESRSICERVIDGCLIMVALLIGAYLSTGVFAEGSDVTTESSPRIAVLRFRTAYGNNADVLSDGLFTELQHELINESGMVVVSPSDQHVSVDTLSLTGCVSIVDDEIRVMATITNNKSGVITWSRAFERPRDDSLSTPGDLARDIVAALPLAAELRNPGDVENAG